MRAKPTYSALVGLSLGLSLYAIPLQAATIFVDSLTDAAPSVDDGNCTLREAIEAANSDASIDACNAGNGADTIEFLPAILSGGNASITLVDNLSDISDPVSESLTLQGPGTNLLSIDGDNSYTMFYLNSPANDQTFYFNDITLESGLATIGSSVEASGGAIHITSGETVFINQVLFSQNTADNGGGAIFMPNSANSRPISLTISRSTFNTNTANGSIGGGAIRGGNASSTLIEDSSFYKNIATHENGNGGAIHLFGSSTINLATVNIFRSTLTKNTAKHDGGAVSISGGGSNTTINHTTIVDNIADSDASGLGNGGGINTSNGSLTLFNSIVASNQDRSPASNRIFDDIYSLNSPSVTNNGFNFIGNNVGSFTTFPAGAPNANNDYVGTSLAKLDPDLGLYGDNGGPTETLIPLTNGTLAVIDKGSCASEPHDQRLLGNNISKKRVVDLNGVPNGAGSDGCDIGAVEAAAVEITPQSSSCFPVRSSNGKIAVICL